MLFNVDAGEGFGNEEELFKYVDLANISCGAHAGSLEETQRVMLLAHKLGVKIGAHPSFPDPENFGRVVPSINHQELKKSLTNQLKHFFSMAETHGLTVFHVKPHGALYHEVARNEKIAQLFFEVLKELEFKGAVIGLPNSLFEEYCVQWGFVLLNEAFADRRYLPNGSLMSRSENGAVIKDQKEINEQVKQLMVHGRVTAGDDFVNLKTETICFHGDHKDSELIVREVKKALVKI